MTEQQQSAHRMQLKKIKDDLLKMLLLDFLLLANVVTLAILEAWTAASLSACVLLFAAFVSLRVWDKYRSCDR